MKIKFFKMNGIGNDFVIIDDRDGTIQQVFTYKELTQKICNRNFSVGADGLIVILNSLVCDLKFRIFNSDGSEAEMCGNGMRCFSRLVFEKKIITKNKIDVETLAGTIESTINLDEKKQVKSVSVDMGKPIFEASKIPFISKNKCAIDETIVVDGEKIKISCVSMGNPHCIIFVPDLTKIEFDTVAPKIETHKKFPLKTNVHFSEIVSDSEINVRVWERGVGETLACGTGACAVFAVASKQGKVKQSAKINLKGGSLTMSMDKAKGTIIKTGGADYSFIGEIEL